MGNTVTSPYGSATDTSAEFDERERLMKENAAGGPSISDLMNHGKLPNPAAPPAPGALPIAPPADVTIQPVKRPPIAGSDAQGNDGAPTTDPVSRPSSPGSPSVPSTPTPFQTPDPLAFLPLASATSAMTPSPPPPAPTSNVTGNVNGQIAPPTTPVQRQQWSASDPRAQAEILAQDYGGDVNAFLAASPSAAVSGMYTDPSYLAAQKAGQNIGSDGSLLDPFSGATTKGADPALAKTVAEPFTALGLNLDGSPMNGLPGVPTTPPRAPAVPAPLTVPTPTLAPVPGSALGAPSTTASAASAAANLNGLPATTPTPAASPATTPSNPSNPSAASATSAPAAADANGLPSSVTAPGPAMNAVTLTPTAPGNALTNSTIAPGPATDRFAIANQRISDWNATEQPMFEQDLRRIAQDRAGAGQIGSGMVRGAFRDAATDLNTRRQTAERGFLTDALTGSIDDAYRNIGIAQQQQGVQIDQQKTAFNQQVQLQQLTDSEQGQQYGQLMTSLGFNAQQIQTAFENAFKVQQLSDDETGQAFYRALQQYITGSANDPASYYEWLAGQWATTGAK